MFEVARPTVVKKHRGGVHKHRSSALILAAALVTGTALLAGPASADSTTHPHGSHHAGNTPLSSTAAYVVDDNQALVWQFTVAADGTMTPDIPASVPVTYGGSGSWTPRQAQVDDITLSPDGKSAYVFSLGDGGTISQFSVSPTDGTLAPKTTPFIDFGQESGPGPQLAFGPNAMAFSRDGKTAYVAFSDVIFPDNSFGPGIIQFAIAADGSLSPTPTNFTTLPWSPLDIKMSPDGKSVYVPNEGNFFPGDPTETKLNGDVQEFSVGAGGVLSPWPRRRSRPGRYRWRSR
ncbi:MAG TPA: hypothetical protein VHV82_18675 [Sporichthyaceae bacterium]|nr:hypothetical protein [Sporichthyaceae bacterium]